MDGGMNGKMAYWLVLENTSEAVLFEIIPEGWEWANSAKKWKNAFQEQ